MKLIILLLLLCQPLQAANRIIFGAELGHTIELDSFGGAMAIDNTVARTGCCSLKAPIATGTYSFLSPQALAAGDLYLRYYMRVSVTTNPTGSTTVMNAMTLYNGAADVAYVRVVVTTAGAVSLRLYNGIGAAQVGSDFAISEDTWYLIEFRAKTSPTSSPFVGVLEMKVDGTVRATQSAINTGTPNITAVVPTGITSTMNGIVGNIWYDDVLVSDSAYPGAGQIVARQAGGAGTPTYNAWTKTPASCLPGCWQDIPYTTDDYSDSATTLTAQTYFIDSFSSTQTGHGTQTVSASDTINVVQGMIITATGSTGTYKIRRRVSSTDTDTTITNSTIPALRREAFWTGTLTNINAMEIGGYQNSAGSSMAVYDTYVMIDYTPSGVAPSAIIPLLTSQWRQRRQ